MIDLTPLDVRNKRGDFKRGMRGYDPDEVNVFLEIVAERLEDLVRQNLQLRERTENLAAQVDSQSGREKAVQEALVTAQELRADIRNAAERDAELTLQEANAQAKRILSEAESDAKKRVREVEQRLEQGQDALEEAERRRLRFLKNFRQLLERELDVVEVEEARIPQKDDSPIELELGGAREDLDTPAADGDMPGMALPDLEEAYDAHAAGEEVAEAVLAEATNIDALTPEEAAGMGADLEDEEASDDRELFALPDFPKVNEEGEEDPRWG